ncbi:MAG: MgtC/SapB family protein [Anaerolineales bacterium]|jgi:putative Mg2+ transporter-C (MgtC) family protein
MAIFPKEVLRLLLALLIGGLIGAEREYRHRAAGLRTIMFICAGAALFTMLSLKLGGEMSPARIAAAVATGVGFLCAGVIMQQGAHLVGLTTASTIWLAASLGMAVGGGYYLLSIVAVAIVMVILLAFPKLEELIYSVQERQTYSVVLGIERDRRERLDELMGECGLRVISKKVSRSGEEMLCEWEAEGAPENHDQLVERLLLETEVKGFKCKAFKVSTRIGDNNARPLLPLLRHHHAAGSG